MAGSPRRIFKGLTLAELNALKANFLSRIADGTFTQLGGAMKNSTREFIDPTDALFEVNYELQVLAGTLGPTVVYQDFTGPRRQPNTIQG